MVHLVLYDHILVVIQLYTGSYTTIYLLLYDYVFVIIQLRASHYATVS